MVENENVLTDSDVIIDPQTITLLEAAATKAETTLELGAVFYTDGSGDQYMRVGGHGVHGYVYANLPSKVTGCQKGYIHTDRGYQTNERAGQDVSIYYVLGETVIDPRDVPVDFENIQPVMYFDANGSHDDATNNIGETMGFLCALRQAKLLYREHGIKKFHFVIDSKYVIGNLSRLESYSKRNWIKSDGKLLANKELWIAVLDEVRDFLQPEIKLEVRWVAGHQDDLGNIRADIQASLGLVAARNRAFLEKTHWKKAKGYWSKKAAEIHPFLLDSYWYTQPSIDDRITHDDKISLFFGHHSEDERFGQPNPDDIHAVAHLDQLPEMLTIIKKKTAKVEQLEVSTGFGYEGIYYADIKELLSPELSDVVDANDQSAVICDTENGLKVLNYRRLPLMVKFHPPRLAKTAYEQIYNSLDDILTRFTTNKLLSHEAVTDITDTVFETVEKKTKNKSTQQNQVKFGFVPAVKAMVKVNQLLENNMCQEIEQEITLTLSITSPNRRVFGNVKDLKPKVYVVTRCLSSVKFTHFVIVVLENGERGIWSNYYANARTIQN